MIPDIFTSILIICQTGISLDCFDVDVSALDIVCETEPSIFPQDCDNPLQESGNFLLNIKLISKKALVCNTNLYVENGSK